MTEAAVDALRMESRQVEDLCAGLSNEEWKLPSGCSGWRVQDVVCHMACVFHSVADPSSIESGPRHDAEASAEVPVQARRTWSSTQISEEYRHWAPLGLEVMASRQAPPLGEMVAPLGNLGSHPLHILANALVFDHYCHMRYDIGTAIERAATLPHSEPALIATRKWMLAGLPQMCTVQLNEAVTSPIRLVFEGPGGGTWSLLPANNAEVCLLVAGDEGVAATTVTSTVHDFSHGVPNAVTGLTATSK